MPLQYHQRTLDLLNITPQIDPAAVAALDALEALRGRKLPAAVREWYQLQGAAQELSGNDEPVPVHELGREIFISRPVATSTTTLDKFLIKLGIKPAPPSTREYPKYPQLPDDLLLLVIENQSVCYWAVKWDESDDPPVLFCDENGEHWYPHADSFSDFVYIRVWDHWIEPYWLETIDEIPYTMQLQELLAQRYTSETITYNDVIWGDQVTYRFSLNHEGQIIAWVFEDKAQVYIASTKEDTLISMAAEILQNSKIPDQLDFYSDLEAEEQEHLCKRIEAAIQQQRGEI